MRAKRLRIFAGPNGSGKSTIERIVSSKYYIGKFINADKIEQTLGKRGRLGFNAYGIRVTDAELQKSIVSSGFASKVDLKPISASLTVSRNIST